MLTVAARISRLAIGGGALEAVRAIQPKKPGGLMNSVGRQAFRRLRHVDADDAAAMHVAHHIDREIVEHRAVDQHLVVRDDRRQDARQRDRGAQRVAQQALRVHPEGALGEIGRDREERERQILDQQVAEMLLQPGIDLVALHQRHDGQHVVGQRIAFDERLADAAVDLVVVPAQATPAPMIAPIDVPPTKSIGQFASRSARMTPICA